MTGANRRELRFKGVRCMSAGRTVVASWRMRMSMKRGRAVSWLVVLPLLIAGTASAADFPYDRELVLNASPMRGSKRVPSLEIGAKGETSIDLWCSTFSGQLIVAGETMTVLIGNKVANSPCDPD